jgi:hypothetical protein
MLVFGSGAAAALSSTFFAYLRRTVRLQAPERVPLRNLLWWLSVLAFPCGGRGLPPEPKQRRGKAKAGLI